ncbi:hypothetical protein TWF225_010924 [Orbilia oligospora]|nr:hypothetical protein TWF225_010924 [Orbilia oligospora]KAF3265766.1 hypothetical protein TWF217_002302 [Orbilia oligospora]KAF3271533.1 hypothetical protein TWF128_000115 [Orbilia oligospora]
MKFSFVFAAAALLATAQAVAIPSTPVKRADIDCDKTVPYNLSKVLKGECKVLCVWAKQSGNWSEFEEHCKKN